MYKSGRISVNQFSCTRRKRLKRLGEVQLPARRLTGSRIREKRLDLGLRQAAVAEAAGISASYLNLIEHNRRRIAGKLLSDLARILGVEPSVLTDGVDGDLLEQMRGAATLAGDVVELSRTEELAARYPGWSQLIALQARRLSVLEERVQTLQDRMTHDPQLADALHDVISAVTSIRSSASILVGQEELDADWQSRFHQNIHADSIRLASSSEAVITYLEVPSTDQDIGSWPSEQMERYLADTAYHLAPLEDPSTNVARFVAASGLKGAALRLFEGFAKQYQADAAAMPLADFAPLCVASQYDPIAISDHFVVSLDAVLRRMSSLPPDDQHPPMGLMVCDNSGTALFTKPVSGFDLPRSGGACPLWPVFGAFSRPAQPIRQEIILPDALASRFICYAIALPVGPCRFDAPPVLQSTALLIPDASHASAQPLEVGISCRICPRAACFSRREPAIGEVAGETAL